MPLLETAGAARTPPRHRSRKPRGCAGIPQSSLNEGLGRRPAAAPILSAASAD